nr:DNA gyrase C-terminal beta-propeller domain-containing protein [Rectinema sp.]
EFSGEVVKGVSVQEEDEVMVITSTGKTIKLSVSSVRQMGKGARGVRIVNIEPPDFVIGIDKIVQEQE